MPRAAGSKDYISLVRGLVTEASSLSFPEGATSAELNFTIDRDGLIRKRRLGFKNLVSEFTVEETGAKIENAFYWRGPSIVGVIITNETPETVLKFHAVDEDFTLLGEFSISSDVSNTQVAETTSLLVITTDTGGSPVICEYEESTGIIKVSNVTIYIRDFEVVDDGLGAATRPNTLSSEHEYNLYNSGWYQSRADANDSNTEKNVSTAFFEEAGEYPSNADVASLGIIDDGDGNLVFDSEFVEEADFGNSLAPRGHYVYSIQNFTRSERVASPLLDGTPSSTLSLIGSVDISGSGTFNPEDGTDGGGGGEDPYNPFPNEPEPPEGGEIP